MGLVLMVNAISVTMEVAGDLTNVPGASVDVAGATRMWLLLILMWQELQCMWLEIGWMWLNLLCIRRVFQHWVWWMCGCGWCSCELDFGLQWVCFVAKLWWVSLIFLWMC